MNIRIDENSTDSRINEVLEMKRGAVFSVARDFIKTFVSKIPENRIFVFTEAPKYGLDCYVVMENRIVEVLTKG